MTPSPNRGRPPGVRIAGTGLAIPERVLTNDDLAKMVDTDDQWIRQRTGIHERRIVENGTNEIDLATPAVEWALASAGVRAGELDMLICASLTPGMVCPSSAARIVARVGAVPAGAVDISAACSGFVYGLNMAATLIQSGHYRNVAVVGVEVLSKIVDWKDRRTCVLFGDGSGAAVMTASDDPEQGCLYQSMASNGDLWAELYVPRTEADLPPNGAFSGTYNTLQMNGREVYKFAVTTLMSTIEGAMGACDLKPDDLAVIIPHQSNKRILESAREKLHLREDQIYINIDRYGNTSAASVPICLHELTEAGRLKTGDLVLFVALGGGMTWSSSLWRL